MSHAFSFNHTLKDISAAQFRTLLATEAFHVKLAKSLHGDRLEILKYDSSTNHVVFTRRHPMKADLPAALQKLVKGSLTMLRMDRWDLNQLVCESEFELSVQVKLALKLHVCDAAEGLLMRHDWNVNVSIPLIGRALAPNIERDIRNQAESELKIFSQHCLSMLV